MHDQGKSTHTHPYNTVVQYHPVVQRNPILCAQERQNNTHLQNPPFLTSTCSPSRSACGNVRAHLLRPRPHPRAASVSQHSVRCPTTFLPLLCSALLSHPRGARYGDASTTKASIDNSVLLNKRENVNKNKKAKQPPKRLEDSTRR